AVGGAARERDVAILELLYATGLRVSELSSLDIEDVDRAGATVRVLGKGRKERIVPFGRRAASALDAYLGPRAERRGTLFTNHRDDIPGDDRRRGPPPRPGGPRR